MVFKYCLGMIMSVSTLMIFKGAATPSSLVNFSIGARPVRIGEVLGQGGLCNANSANNKGANPTGSYVALALLRPGLDAGHILVRQAKMMADLVDQHVADDVAQAFLVLGPIVQDRPAVEPDHVGQPGDITGALEGQADALEQAEQVELALALHLVQHLVGRKIVDADDQA